MFRRQVLENGRVKVTPLANFAARIVRDVVLDNDAWQRREFGVEAELGKQRFTFLVPATEFSRMGWVLKHLGPRAIVYPGQHQHARAAIQCLSGPIRQERVFTQMGWSKQGADWMYLQAGGAVGSQGLREDLRVRFFLSLHGSGKLIVFAEQNNGFLWQSFVKTVARHGNAPGKIDAVLTINALDSGGRPRFIHSGTYEQLLEAFHLSPVQIAQAIAEQV